MEAVLHQWSGSWLISLLEDILCDWQSEPLLLRALGTDRKKYTSTSNSLKAPSEQFLKIKQTCQWIHILKVELPEDRNETGQENQNIDSETRIRTVWCGPRLYQDGVLRPQALPGWFGEAPGIIRKVWCGPRLYQGGLVRPQALLGRCGVAPGVTRVVWCGPRLY